jgi:hypothetical protein
MYGGLPEWVSRFGGVVGGVDVEVVVEVLPM